MEGLTLHFQIQTFKGSRVFPFYCKEKSQIVTLVSLLLTLNRFLTLLWCVLIVDFEQGYTSLSSL